MPNPGSPPSHCTCQAATNAPRTAVSAAPPRAWSNREWRIASLITLIAIVSLADLYLTLTYLHSGGMAEANPIARWIMRLGQPWLLGLFKVVLVTFTCSTFWWFRKRTSAEIAAWIGCLAMALLCFQWHHYTKHVADAVTAHPELTQADSWVQYGD